jgi:hypothetical protein
MKKINAGIYVIEIKDVRNFILEAHWILLEEKEIMSDFY